MKLTKLFSILLTFILFFSGCSFSNIKEIRPTEVKNVNITNNQKIEIIKTGCNNKTITPINIEHFKIRNFHTSNFNTKGVDSEDIIENVNYLIDKVENIKTLNNKIANLTARGETTKLAELNLELQNALIERNSVKAYVLDALNQYKTYLRDKIKSFINFNYSSLKPTNIEEYKNKINILQYEFDVYKFTKNSFNILEAMKVLSDEIFIISNLIDDYSNNILSDSVIDPNLEIMTELDPVIKKTDVIKFFSIQINSHINITKIKIEQLNNDTELINQEMLTLDNEIKEIDDEIDDLQKIIDLSDFYLYLTPTASFNTQSGIASPFEATLSNGFKINLKKPAQKSGGNNTGNPPKAQERGSDLFKNATDFYDGVAKALENIEKEKEKTKALQEESKRRKQKKLEDQQKAKDRKNIAMNPSNCFVTNKNYVQVIPKDEELKKLKEKNAKARKDTGVLPKGGNLSEVTNKAKDKDGNVISSEHFYTKNGKNTGNPKLREPTIDKKNDADLDSEQKALKGSESFIEKNNKDPRVEKIEMEINQNMTPCKDCQKKIETFLDKNNKVEFKISGEQLPPPKGTGK